MLYSFQIYNLIFFFFYLVTVSLLVYSVLNVIIVNNTIYSIFFFIFAVLNFTSLLILLESEFLGMLFIIVYVGAIAVLFLFIIMMLDIKKAQISYDLTTHLPISGFIAFFFFIEIFLILDMNFVGFCQPFFGFYESSFLYTVVNFFISVDSEASCFLFSQVYLFNWLTLTNNTTNIISIGNVLYTLFFNGFIISSVVLLIAMIGSIVLTINKPFLLVDKLFLLKIK